MIEGDALIRGDASSRNFPLLTQQCPDIAGLTMTPL
jgi:hypothetical protein